MTFQGYSADVRGNRMESMSPFVIRVIASGADSPHHLSRGRTIVGRSREADIEISELAAARQHCVLDWDEGLACHQLKVWGYNGVLVDGALLRAGGERHLSAGAELRIGGTLLKYEDAADPRV